MDINVTITQAEITAIHGVVGFLEKFTASPMMPDAIKNWAKIHLPNLKALSDKLLAKT